MTYKELLEAWSEQCMWSPKEAKRYLKRLINIILNELVGGGEVKIDRFGRFYNVEYGNTMRTLQGKEIFIEPSVTPRFKFSESAKELVKERNRRKTKRGTGGRNNP